MPDAPKGLRVPVWTPAQLAVLRRLWFEAQPIPT